MTKKKTLKEEFRKELEELLDDQIYNRVVNIKYLANKIVKATDKYSVSKLTQREAEVRGEIESGVMEMHKEQNQSIKDRISFMPTGDYSQDYAKGISRGITLVGRYLNSLNQNTK